MDTTPSNLMFAAMKKFTDAICGDEPPAVDQSKGAIQIRIRRRFVMDFLHQFGSTCMREGVNRKVLELKGARDSGGTQVFDGADKSAQSRAVDDAHAGKQLVVIK